MRLDSSQIQIIRSIINEILGQDAKIILFGSRVDDAARGGDIDLMITVKEQPINTVFTASLIAAKLERALSGRRVDIILKSLDSPLQPIHEIALSSGINL